MLIYIEYEDMSESLKPPLRYKRLINDVLQHEHFIKLESYERYGIQVMNDPESYKVLASSELSSMKTWLRSVWIKVHQLQ
jgi:hypothetical protein